MGRKVSSRNPSALRGLTDAQQRRRPPFFFMGEYPVDARSNACFSEQSWKILAATMRRGDAGDVEEGGGSRASATSQLVTAAGEASGERGGG
jgi:hypothetical protein